METQESNELRTKKANKNNGKKAVDVYTNPVMNSTVRAFNKVLRSFHVLPDKGVTNSLDLITRLKASWPKKTRSNDSLLAWPSYCDTGEIDLWTREVDLWQVYTKTIRENVSLCSSYTLPIASFAPIQLGCLPPKKMAAKLETIEAINVTNCFLLKSC